MSTGIIEREKLLAWLKPRLTEDRYLHSIGAEKAAKELAKRFGYNEEKAGLAALIHDNAKNISYEHSLDIIKDNNFLVPEDIKANKKIIHAFLGALLAQKELVIDDNEILDAIKYHTTGRLNMTLLEKIVFLADKIEEKTRNAEFRNQVLSKLNETNDINEAVIFCIDASIRSLLDRRLEIHCMTVDIWNEMLHKTLK